jgi:hypothetical protein
MKNYNIALLDAMEDNYEHFTTIAFTGAAIGHLFIGERFPYGVLRR